MRLYIDAVNQFLSETKKSSHSTLAETQDLEEIGKLGTALGAAGMAGLAMTGAADQAAAQANNPVRHDIFVQYDVNQVQQQFAKDLEAVKKLAPTMSNKIDQMMQEFNELNKTGKQLVWNMQSGMKVPSDSAQIAKWIQFTARNINLASQMQ